MPKHIEKESGELVSAVLCYKVSILPILLVL